MIVPGLGGGAISASLILPTTACHRSVRIVVSVQKYANSCSFFAQYLISDTGQEIINAILNRNIKTRIGIIVPTPEVMHNVHIIQTFH